VGRLPYASFQSRSSLPKPILNSILTADAE
jgi:hypothetical protein